MYDTATEALLATLPARLHEIPARWAAETPDAPALQEAGRCWTYAELDAAIIATAQQLRDLSLRPGDRLLVVGENCVTQVVLTFAASRLDAWVVHASARLSGPEIDTIAAHAGARRAIFNTQDSPEAALHAHRHGATTTATPLGQWMLGPLNADCQPEPVHADSARQAAALIYTTGTTGAPKGVMLSHRNLLFIATVSSRLRGLVSSDRAYGVLPISHVYGLASVMLGTLCAGACLHLAPRFAPEALLHALRHDGLTIVQGVPAMYARLLETLAAPGAAPDLLQSAGLRFIYAGGSPLDPALKRRVEAAFGLPLHNGYGMTESAPTISQTRLDAPRSDTSVGPAIPGVALRIVDSAGADVAAGAAGELWVRGPNVMLGYYRAPALSAQALRHGDWLNTGDMARQEPDGALFIVGRTKELIIRSGFNVFPLEVETVLNAYPAVRQSAVVGRRLPDGEEQVVAYIEWQAGQAAASASVDALQAHLAQHLVSYKLPAQIIVMAALPAAASGKILKGRLREMAQA